MSFTFGPFRLQPLERLLERDGVPVAIGSRAFDLLTVLVEKGGAVVSKRELTDRAWPETIVDEVSLRVHMSSLRKLLGEASGGGQYITNVTGRGYTFSVPVRQDPQTERQVDFIVPEPTDVSLPPLPTRMVGRDHVVQEVSRQLLDCRFLNIVGAGGMGKTTVAVATAHTVRSRFPAGVFFADFTAVAEGELVASTMATLLKIPVGTSDITAGIASFIREKQLLLVLDNCEHVVEHVARFTEDIVTRCPGVHLLTTSREALRVVGEHVFIIPPLETPPPGSSLSSEELQNYPAVRLFLDRAYASGADRDPSEAEVAVAADLCRRLEGVALAIELVAGRAGVRGLLKMPELLDHRFGIHWQGRRTALPRHQTMAALHDWSYNLLTHHEKLAFRRLGWIAGAFTADAALAVTAFTDIVEATKVIEGLADKYLLARPPAIDGAFRFRMAETTRAYASQKLQQVHPGELRETALLHANYYLSILREGLAKASTFNTTGIATSHPDALPNIRQALRWSFESTGDTTVGVQLAAACGPLLLEQSLLEECYRWASLGLEAMSDGVRGTIEEAHLQQSLAIAGIIVREGKGQVARAFTRALEIAREQDNKRMQLDVLAGFNIFVMRAGDCHQGLKIALDCEHLLKDMNDPYAEDLVQWMLGVAYSYAGELALARHYLERSCTEHKPYSGTANLCVFTQRTRAYVQFARVLFLQGSETLARRIATKGVDDAAAYGHPIPHCIALAYAASTAIWLGDREEAASFIGTLRHVSKEHSLAAFHAVSRGLEAELAIRSGQAEDGVAIMGEVLEIMEAENHHHMTVSFRAALAEGLFDMGNYSRALSVIDQAIESANAGGEKFQLADMYRLKALIASRVGGQAPLVDSKKFTESARQLAEKQGAKAFLLRLACPSY